MKIVQIVHNPTAGNGEHHKEDLIRFVEKAGVEVNYVSTHDLTWRLFPKNNFDYIILAGGDGTVHKMASVLLKIKNLSKPAPVYILPFGTANNISRTLKLGNRNFEEDFQQPEMVRDFDYGRIKGISGNNFFLESVGMGLFPKLIEEMKREEEIKDREEKLEHTVEVLQKIVGSFVPENVEISIDGEEISGAYIMVEVMNTNYIGPNLKLAPNANFGDGLLDVVLISPEDKKSLLDYLREVRAGNSEQFDVSQFLRTFRGKEITIKYFGKHFHVDDDLVDNLSGQEIQLNAISGVLEFFSAK